jgi:hypothetical protein
MVVAVLMETAAPKVAQTVSVVQKVAQTVDQENLDNQVQDLLFRTMDD